MTINTRVPSNRVINDNQCKHWTVGNIWSLKILYKQFKLNHISKVQYFYSSVRICVSFSDKTFALDIVVGLCNLLNRNLSDDHVTQRGNSPSSPASSPGVDVCGLDGVEEQLGHTHPLHVDEVRLKQSLGGFEPFTSHLDHPAVWKLRTHDNISTFRKVTTSYYC